MWCVRGQPPHMDTKCVDSWPQCHNAVVEHSARAGQTHVLTLREKAIKWYLKQAWLPSELSCTRRYLGMGTVSAHQPLNVLLATGSWTRSLPRPGLIIFISHFCWHLLCRAVPHSKHCDSGQKDTPISQVSISVFLRSDVILLLRSLPRHVQYLVNIFLGSS